MAESVNQTAVSNETSLTVAYSRKNPFPGRMLVNRRLNSPDSEKDTRHFEISLEGSGLTYEVGDSMAVYPTNDPALVDEILKALDAKGDENRRQPGNPNDATRRLLRDYSITQVTPKFLKTIAERASAAPLLNELLEPERKHDLETYLWGLEVIDFLVEHPSIKFAPQEFVALLPKLQPRLYSIASSLKFCPEAVHFIVDTVKYRSHGRTRKGVCSTFLADRCSDSPVPIYPTPSKFRLPEDITCRSSWSGRARVSRHSALSCRNARRPAPAARRGCSSVRSARRATFFTRQDFEKFMADGVLSRIDTAFSRDQAHKIYVQDRMKEASGELWKWLEEGAYFYVCGDAKRMAKDVDATLRQIVQEGPARVSRKRTNTWKS